jgi:hypothetical protein
MITIHTGCCYLQNRARDTVPIMSYARLSVGVLYLFREPLFFLFANLPPTFPTVFFCRFLVPPCFFIHSLLSPDISKTSSLNEPYYSGYALPWANTCRLSIFSFCRHPATIWVLASFALNTVQSMSSSIGDRDVSIDRDLFISFTGGHRQ